MAAKCPAWTAGLSKRHATADVVAPAMRSGTQAETAIQARSLRDNRTTCRDSVLPSGKRDQQRPPALSCGNSGEK